jgi:hypothetical protein
MAFWSKRKNGSIQVWTYVDGKQKQVPREFYRFLDGQPDHNVDAWVREYEIAHEGRRFAPEGPVCPELIKLVDRHIARLAKETKHKNTQYWHKRFLLDYALPFFLTQKTPKRNPNDWHGSSHKFTEWLEDLGVSYDNILRARIALRVFYRWLKTEKIVLTKEEFILGKVLKDKATQHTPLRRAITPEDVLAWANAVPTETEHGEDIKLIGLLGYFTSARPQEIFAFKRSDFRLGVDKNGNPLEACITMRKLGLYDKLAVLIERQRSTSGVSLPKGRIIANVACFNEAAVRIIAASLSKRTGSLFTKNNHLYYKLWKDMGYPGATIKDLRRASLYWLGNTTQIPPAALMNHARHRNIATTQKYMRRPFEAVESESEIDLELALGLDFDRSA